MAFVSQSTRGLLANFEKNNEQSQKLSEIQSVKKVIKPANSTEQYAPFGSTQQRIKYKFPLNPGVGQYEVTQQMQSPKTKTYKCKNQLMLKVIKQEQSNFASKQPRFKQENYMDKACVGDYNIEGNIAQKLPQQRKRANSDSPKKRKRYENIQTYLALKRNKIESIPQMGKEFVQSENQQDMFLSKYLKQSPFKNDGKNQTIGPGQYNMKDQFAENSQGKACVWSKNKGQRFDQYIEKDIEIGPGKYQCQSMSPKDPRRIYSNYVSNTTRSFWDNIYFKTNMDNPNNLNVLKNKNTIQTGPSPDQYILNDGLKTKQNPYAQFEFFGSTEEKFKDQQVSYNISPGQYNIKSLNFRTSRSLSPGFNTTSVRSEIDQQKNINTNPGPNHYEQQEQTINKKIDKVKNGQNIGKFGVSDIRFRPSKQETQGQPGPAKYQFQNDWVKDPKNLKLNSVFKSKTNREVFQEQKDYQEGRKDYNINNMDISHKIHQINKQQKQLKRVNTEQAAFSTKEIRFKSSQNQQFQNNNNNNSTNLGKFTQSKSPTNMLPAKHNQSGLLKGQKYQSKHLQQQQQQNQIFQQNQLFQNQPKKIPYNHNNTNTSNNNQMLHPQNQPEQQPFLFNAKKLDSIYKDHPDTVGPGHYNPHLQNWNKKTYNVKFSNSPLRNSGNHNNSNSNVNSNNNHNGNKFQL